MYIIEVKHKEDHYKSYWFEVPAALANTIKKGDKVMCETCRGWQEGIAQTGVLLLSGGDIDHFIEAAGARLPLKRVIETRYKIPMKNIKIYPAMEATRPAADKIAKRIEELYKNGAFNTKVSLDLDGHLQDGYTAYLVAKMFDLDHIPVWIAAPI